MKRKTLVLSLLALAVVALTAADASAWGWWRHRSSCCGPRFHWFGHGHHACGYQPYNAFSPRPSCCHVNYGCAPGCAPRGHHFGHRHGGHAPAACAPIGGCCLAAPVMSNVQTAQYIDPSLLPYLQTASLQMPVEMPLLPMAYPAPYGVQPANYTPAYYQPYPTYYYPQQPSYPSYGFNFGY